MTRRFSYHEPTTASSVSRESPSLNVQFLFEHHVALDRGTVFAFHEYPAHLDFLMAGWKPFRLLHHHGSITPGCEVWIEENTLGIIPVALGYRHHVYEPPIRFGERLIHGPFSEFTHIHEFIDDGHGGTTVRDHLEVRLPWQYGGEPAMKLIAARRIRQAFATRGRNLQRLAEDGAITRILREGNDSNGQATPKPNHQPRPAWSECSSD